MACDESRCNREVYRSTILPQETNKKYIYIKKKETNNTLNRQPNFTPKTTKKRRTKNPKVSIRKEIIKSRAE